MAAQAPEPVAPDAQALARLLGAGPVAPAAAPAAASRFALEGVLAGTASGHGAALIAVDGKPPKPYRVGAEVEPGLDAAVPGAQPGAPGAFGERPHQHDAGNSSQEIKGSAGHRRPSGTRIHSP